MAYQKAAVKQSITITLTNPNAAVVPGTAAKPAVSVTYSGIFANAGVDQLAAAYQAITGLMKTDGLEKELFINAKYDVIEAMAD